MRQESNSLKLTKSHSLKLKKNNQNSNIALLHSAKQFLRSEVVRQTIHKDFFELKNSIKMAHRVLSKDSLSQETKIKILEKENNNKSRALQLLNKTKDSNKTQSINLNKSKLGNNKVNSMKLFKNSNNNSKYFISEKKLNLIALAKQLVDIEVEKQNYVEDFDEFKTIVGVLNGVISLDDNETVH